MSFTLPRDLSHGRVAMLMDALAEAEALEDGAAAPPPSTTFIIEALETLGFEPIDVALEENRVAHWMRALLDGGFRMAFNLCETVEGHARGEHLPAAAVELLGIPMTGASSTTLLYCLHKDRCAAVLATNGVRVPAWRCLAPEDPTPRWHRFPAIVKPAAEDGSNGVYSDSVARSQEELAAIVEWLRPDWEELVVQEYVDGREVNVAIVGDHVLPIAEIDFTHLPEGEPRIVSYAAKWEVESEQYHGTRPVCPAALSHSQRRDVLRVATRAWELMDGVGYARIDVRVRDDGVPFVIDVNPNPDLSPDAGLARQAAVAGWSYESLIGSIAEDALQRGGGDAAPAPGRRHWTRVRPALVEERPA